MHFLSTGELYKLAIKYTLETSGLVAFNNLLVHTNLSMTVIGPFFSLVSTCIKRVIHNSPFIAQFRAHPRYTLALHATLLTLLPLPLPFYSLLPSLHCSLKTSIIMYILSPHLCRVPHPTSMRRALRALDTRHSSTILTPDITPLEPPVVPPVPKIATLDPSLQSTWGHRAWVAVGSTSIATALVSSVVAAANSGVVIEPIFAALAGYVLADLGTGFYHFAIDNYGGPSTPIFGSQIEGFQGHHRQPSTITRRQPANNLHALARAVSFVVFPLEVAVSSSSGATAAAAHAFIGVCAGCIMLSQKFHAWAHTSRGRVPSWVGALQDSGVLISRDMHGAHHRVPYNNNYCIVSGVWNWVLDEYKVFEIVEMIIFFKFGVRPRSWGETAEEWTEEEEEVTIVRFVKSI